MKKKIASFFNIFVLAVIVPSVLFFGGESARSGKSAARVPDEILVKFKDSNLPVCVRITRADDFAKILRYYQNLPVVDYAEPNYTYQASLIPSDTYFNNQWYLQKIKATQAWNDVRESSNVVIAILDSGVQITHPDLSDNIWLNKKEIAGNGLDDDKNGFIDDVNGWDFINDMADPSPKFQPGFTEDGINHGTIIAGIAAASTNNATGIAGVTWKAKLMPLKVLDDKGEGSTAKVIKAIDYAVANGAGIINLSFVGFGYSKSLDDAVKRAADAGIIVVAAGGNEQAQGQGYNLNETPMYPVCLGGGNGENQVIGVAATDTIDQKAPFSSFGNKCIDIAAPGMSIFSTVVYAPTNYLDGQPFNQYYDGYWSGTSAAVPMVSAGLALIESANPSLNRNEVIKILLSAADNINQLNPEYVNKLGSGRLNLSAAVIGALNQLKNKTEKLLVAPRSNYKSLVKITDQDGKTDKEFLAFDKKLKGGINLVACDLNGDGNEEIVAAAAAGAPLVKIFGLDGTLKGIFSAYKKNFTGGLNLACADVNKDGREEIITAQSSSGDSEVKIFNYKGGFLGSFYAYDNKFKGGLNIATGDLDGDGEAEIATGLTAGKIPEVKVFKPIGVMLSQFLAYPKTFRGGVKVAIANIKGGTRRDRAQIITAPEKSGGPHLKFFDSKGNLLNQWFAFNDNFRGGVSLAAVDVDNDGLDEIVAAAGPSGAPHVRVFKANGRIVGSFYAYEENFSGGVQAAGLKILK